MQQKFPVSLFFLPPSLIIICPSMISTYLTMTKPILTVTWAFQSSIHLDTFEGQQVIPPLRTSILGGRSKTTWCIFWIFFNPLRKSVSANKRTSPNERGKHLPLIDDILRKKAWHATICIRLGRLVYQKPKQNILAPNKVPKTEHFSNFFFFSLTFAKNACNFI